MTKESQGKDAILKSLLKQVFLSEAFNCVSLVMIAKCSPALRFVF
jgi:hypothetical protein